MRYHNSQWRFDLDLPNGWAEPGLLKRVFSFPRHAQQSANPEFYGPSGASLKIAIGPISPVPSVEEQQKNLERIAAKYGHKGGRPGVKGETWGQSYIKGETWGQSYIIQLTRLVSRGKVWTWHGSCGSNTREDFII